MNTLTALRVWFQGRKTILGGAVLIAAGIAGAFTGKLSVVDAVTVAGFGISICGVGAKANHFLGALTQIAQAGVDLRLGNKAGAIAALRPVAIEVAEDVAPALTLAPPLPLAPIPIVIPAPPPMFADPSLSGKEAMQPGPARTVGAAELADLQAKAPGEKS